MKNALPCFSSLAATTATEPVKPTTATTGKKHDVPATTVASSPVASTTTERQNRADTRQPTDEATEVEESRQSSAKDASVHAAKRKKLARNGKLVGNDGFDDVVDQKPTPTTETVAAVDRKPVSSAVVELAVAADTKTLVDRVKSPTTAEKTRDGDADAVVEATGTGHMNSEKDADAEVARLVSAGGSGSVSSVAHDDKDRADLLDVDDEDDDVAGSFAMFAPAKSTSGVGKMADDEFPVSQQQQQSSRATSRTDSYDRLSTGGAATAMGDSGYQTYDHDLSALDDRDRQPQPVPDRPSSAAARPEVTSSEPLEPQSSISEPEIADAAAHYSASSDSEISVELPSFASSSGADKPTPREWQLPQATSAVSINHEQTSHDDDGQRGNIARRASQEDLEEEAR